MGKRYEMVIVMVMVMLRNNSRCIYSRPRYLESLEVEVCVDDACKSKRCVAGRGCGCGSRVSTSLVLALVRFLVFIILYILVNLI